MKNINGLIKELTVEEKAALLEGVDSWSTNAIPHLHIPALFLTDGPHGLRKVKRAAGGFGVTDNAHSTAFPTSAAAASSWNPENTYRMGEAIAEECLASGVNVLLAPGVNIKRSPLCGRNFEYYSEDPLLSGAFGSAFVRGAQSKGVGCSVKHFAANSNENYRFVGDSVVDERVLREIYLRAFEQVIKEAKPYTVMASYNRLNGTFASQNRWLLTDLLRGEWGFDGLVMTDWGATCDRVKSLCAGCDLDMPGGVWHNRKSIMEAAKSGVLPMAVLDLAVKRVLALIDKCSAQKGAKGYDAQEHAALSCEIAKDSAVLLKNDGALPLTGNEKLLVVGEMFEKMRYQGAGSSLINPPKAVTPKNAFDSRGIAYTYEKGFRCFYSKRDPALEQAALAEAEKADTVLFFGGLSDFEESEGFDRGHMRLGENQTALLEKLIAKGKKVVLVLFTGAPVELPFLDGLSALLDMVLPGMHGGEATAALLYGETVPSGKLAESWPMCAGDSSCFADYDRGPVSRYYESIYVGYRFYDKAGTKLRFPFGYGLSYTTFAYGHLSCHEKEGTILVKADITNSGSRDGSEIVQLYVKNNKSGVFKAKKELRAFTKVFLKAGETKTVTMAFEKADLAYWNVKRHGWILENGTYEICVAASAEDIRLAAPLVIADASNEGAPYPESVSTAYIKPPQTVPACFEQLLGHPVPVLPKRPLTLESSLNDFKSSPVGWILYQSVMATVRKEYKEAQKLPDSLERDTRLKNSFFVTKLMPFNSIRSMCMSSSGQFTYNTAVGFVNLANGRLIRGLKAFLKKETPGPLPKDERKGSV